MTETHSWHSFQAFAIKGLHFVTKIFSIYLSASNFSLPFLIHRIKTQNHDRKYSRKLLICHCCCRMHKSKKCLMFKLLFFSPFIFLSQSSKVQFKKDNKRTIRFYRKFAFSWNIATIVFSIYTFTKNIPDADERVTLLK